MALTYEFRVVGHLDDHWSAWLGELTITRHHDGTSTLTGPVADQAQLHGVLVRLRDIGATLLSPERPRGPPHSGDGIVVLDVLAVGRRIEQVTGWDLGWRIDCQARSL